MGSGDQSIKGPLTKLFGFGLSIIEKMAVVKIVTEDGGERTEDGRTDGKLFSKILMFSLWNESGITGFYEASPSGNPLGWPSLGISLGTGLIKPSIALFIPQ